MTTTRRGKLKLGFEPAAALAALTKLEDEWISDRLRADGSSTDKILAENYRGGTSDGRPQSKADFIRSTQLAKVKYESAAHELRNIDLHGNVAISTGLVALKSAHSEKRYRYLRVFVLNDSNEWSLIASQSAHVQKA